MSNIIGRHNRALKHFQIPSDVIDLGMIKEWSASATKLYFCLWRRVHRYSEIAPELSAAEITKLSGLSANSIKSAREELVRWGVIEATQVDDGFCYIMLDPRTKKRLNGRPARHARTDSVIVQPYRKISELTVDEITCYFIARGIDVAASGIREQINALCPFHGDQKPSLSINLKKGVWNCHGCGARGGIIDFEMRHSRCTKAAAYQNVAAITGANDILATVDREEPEARYDYVDEQGEVLYTINRYQGKKFRPSRLNREGRTVRNLDGVTRILYNLRAVMKANTVIVCEGEKDCDNVNRLGLLDADGYPVAATTSGAAGTWKNEYSKVLAGKRVVIFPDDDEAGVEHAHSVRASVTPYAESVKIVWRIDAKDVSAYLENHTPQELIATVGMGYLQMPPTPLLQEIQS